MHENEDVKPQICFDFRSGSQYYANSCAWPAVQCAVCYVQCAVCSVQGVHLLGGGGGGGPRVAGRREGQVPQHLLPNVGRQGRQDIRVYGGFGGHGHLGWRSENKLRRCWLELTFAVVSFFKVPLIDSGEGNCSKAGPFPRYLIWNTRMFNKGRDGCQDPCLLSSWFETAISVDLSDNMGTWSTEITSHMVHGVKCTWDRNKHDLLSHLDLQHTMWSPAGRG